MCRILSSSAHYSPRAKKDNNFWSLKNAKSTWTFALKCLFYYVLEISWERSAWWAKCGYLLRVCPPTGKSFNPWKGFLSAGVTAKGPESNTITISDEKAAVYQNSMIYLVHQKQCSLYALQKWPNKRKERARFVRRNNCSRLTMSSQ